MDYSPQNSDKKSVFSMRSANVEGGAESAVGGLEGSGNHSSGHGSGSSLGAADEDFMARAWEMFSALAVRGVLDSQNFLHFASDMGLECEPVHVIKALRREDIAPDASITFTQACRLVEVLPQVQFDDASDASQTSEARVVRLLPWEYATHRVQRKKELEELPPGETLKDRRIYKLVLCRLTPQQWLIATTALVFVVVIAAIVATMGSLWLRSDRHGLDKFLELVAMVAQHFTTQTRVLARETLLDTMQDATHLFARHMQLTRDRHVAAFGNETYVRMVELALFAAAVSRTGATAVPERMASRINATVLAGTHAVVGAEPHVLRAVTASLAEWALRDDMHFAVFNASDNAIVRANVPAAKAVLAACYAPLSPSGSTAKGVVTSGTGLDGTSGANVAYGATPLFKACASMTPAAIAGKIRQYVVRQADSVNEASLAAARASNGTIPVIETLVAFSKNVASVSGSSLTSVFDIQTKHIGNAMLCNVPVSATGPVYPTPAREAACTALRQAMDNCRVAQCKNTNLTTTHYTGEVASVSLTYEPMSDTVIAAVLIDAEVAFMVQEALITLANNVNDAHAASFEITLSSFSKNFEIIPQVTVPKSKAACADAQCSWGHKATEMVRSAFQSNRMQSSFLTSYALEPVVSAVVPLKGDTAFSLMLSSDTEQQDEIEVRAMGSALGDVNDHLHNGVEVQLYHRTGEPLVQTFSPSDVCPTGVLCTSVAGFGVVERSDCPLCTPRRNATVAVSGSSVEFLSPLRCSGCTAIDPAVDMTLFRIPMNAPTAASTGSAIVASGADYKGVDVTAHLYYVPDVASYLSVSGTLERMTKFRSEVVGICFGVALVFVGIGLLLARRSLQTVEGEWVRFKAGIETEKQKFDAMIGEIVPAKVLAKYHKGQKAISEAQSSISVAFVDAVSFSERQKALTPRDIVRTIAYHIELYTITANKFKLFRLKSFGDTTVVIGGIGSKEPPSGVAFGVACFAGYITQMLSPLFSHFPQRVDHLADLFRGESKEVPWPVMQVRVGLHTGTATTALIDYGRTPAFDVFGPVMSLARRMQVTAAPGRINCSTNFKEQLEAGDFGGQFEFDTIRKLVVKSQGTVSTFPIRSLCLEMDESLLQRLHIEYAAGMFDFRPLTALSKGGAPSKSQSASSQAHSNKTGDSNTIHDSMMASTNPPGDNDNRGIQ